MFSEVVARHVAPRRVLVATNHDAPWFIVRRRVRAQLLRKEADQEWPRVPNVLNSCDWLEVSPCELGAIR